MTNTNNPVLDREVENGTQHTFTQDWFSQHIPLWTQFMSECLPGRRKFLEIGSFEGRSSCWLLENALAEDGELYCIDTWAGAPEFHMLPREVVADSKTKFSRNIALSRRGTQKLLVFQNESVKGLADLITGGHGASFDFIYVDGGHQAFEALTDACMAWPLLKIGGLMIFDDYLWDLHNPLEMRPKIAIDAFTAMFNHQLQTIYCGDQYAVRKVA